MLPRILEPEVMDSAEEARDYDAMDHSEVNRRFVADLLALATDAERSSARAVNVLDVGTGTALIPIELCRAFSSSRITAADLAAHMLQLGQRNVIRAGFSTSIRLDHVDAKGLPYADAAFDWVISNSIIHHIPQPGTVLSEMVRVLRPGGLVFVRDLLRPPDESTLDQLVTSYAGDANPHQQQMFRDSLHAALTLDEVRDLAGQHGLSLDSVQQTSDRHWTLACRKP